MAGSSTLELDADVKAKCDAIGEAIEKVQLTVRELLKSEPDSVEEKYNLEVNKALILASTYYVFLKVSGIDTANHPITKELERIKRYMKRDLVPNNRFNHEVVGNTENAGEKTSEPSKWKDARNASDDHVIENNKKEKKRKNMKYSQKNKQKKRKRS